DDVEAQVVVNEAGMGVDLGVDAGPELNGGLELLRLREELRLRVCGGGYGQGRQAQGKSALHSAQTRHSDSPRSSNPSAPNGADSMAGIMSIDPRPRPDAVHVRKTGQAQNVVADISSLFLSA